MEALFHIVLVASVISSIAGLQPVTLPNCGQVGRSVRSLVDNDISDEKLVQIANGQLANR